MEGVAPRRAHNARKVSRSVGRLPPRKEALGWQGACLAWADLRTDERFRPHPAAPSLPFLLLGPGGRALWDTRPGWENPR